MVLQGGFVSSLWYLINFVIFPHYWLHGEAGGRSLVYRWDVEKAEVSRNFFSALRNRSSSHSCFHVKILYNCSFVTFMLYCPFCSWSETSCIRTSLQLKPYCSGTFLHVEYENYSGEKELYYAKRVFSCGSRCSTSLYVVAWSRTSDVGYRIQARCFSSRVDACILYFIQFERAWSWKLLYREFPGFRSFRQLAVLLQLKYFSSNGGIKHRITYHSVEIWESPFRNYSNSSFFLASSLSTRSIFAIALRFITLFQFLV